MPGTLRKKYEYGEELLQAVVSRLVQRHIQLASLMC